MRHSSDPDAETIAGMAAELRALVGKLRRRMREQASSGELTWSQFMLLGQIARDGPATVSDLARAENMRPQSMGAIVAALEAAGLVRSETDPQDARRSIIHLTETGRAQVQSNWDAREDWLFLTISSRFSAAERQELQRGITLLRRLLDA